MCPYQIIQLNPQIEELCELNKNKSLQSSEYFTSNGGKKVMIYTPHIDGWFLGKVWGFKKGKIGNKIKGTNEHEFPSQEYKVLFDDGSYEYLQLHN